MHKQDFIRLFYRSYELLITVTGSQNRKFSKLDLCWRLSASTYVLIRALIIILRLSNSIILVDLQTLRRRSVDLLYWNVDSMHWIDL